MNGFEFVALDVGGKGDFKSVFTQVAAHDNVHDFSSAIRSLFHAKVCALFCSLPSLFASFVLFIPHFLTSISFLSSLLFPGT